MCTIFDGAANLSLNVLTLSQDHERLSSDDLRSMALSTRSTRFVLELNPEGSLTYSILIGDNFIEQ